MSLEEHIRKKITAAFSPVHLELFNESHMHNVPPGSESHFRMILVSPLFEGLGLVDQQRKVNEILAEELAGPVHAFTQQTFTPEAWSRIKESHKMESPRCLGGGESDLPNP